MYEIERKFLKDDSKDYILKRYKNWYAKMIDSFI